EADKRSELLYEFGGKSFKLGGSVFSFNEISERLKEFKQNLTKINMH
ncbi:4247_t:CDS:1, partial [Cetraspora pellucida]